MFKLNDNCHTQITWEASKVSVWGQEISSLHIFFKLLSFHFYFEDFINQETRWQIRSKLERMENGLLSAFLLEWVYTRFFELHMDEV